MENFCARRSWLYRQKAARINSLRFFQQALFRGPEVRAARHVFGNGINGEEGYPCS